MTYLHAVVLALVQGVTEFLPISSSAHLVLVPYFLGWPDQGIGFDIATNTGTLLAVVVYLRHEVARLTLAGLRSIGSLLRGRGAVPREVADAGQGPAESAADDGPPSRTTIDTRLAWAVALGTIPVAVAGLLAYHLVASAARNPLVIASTSIGFGLLLWWADRAGSRRRSLDGLTWWDTVVVGCAQALALIPGTSRSGITITAGLGQGFTREDAARFSFLLYVPVGVLAAARQLLEVVSDGFQVTSLGPTLVGFAVSAVSAYLAIGALLAWVRRQSLTVFVVYRVVLGVVILAVVFLA